jgi:hypothetical protein
MNLARSLKAVDVNSVRFFNETTADRTSGYKTRNEYFQSIDDNAVVFEFVSNTEGGKVFKAKGYKNMLITSSNILYTYDPVSEKARFEFSYDYERGGTTYRIKGKLSE